MRTMFPVVLCMLGAACTNTVSESGTNGGTSTGGTSGGTSTGGTSAGGTGGTSGGGSCGSEGTCSADLTCCDGQFCVYFEGDSLNCGGCGVICGPGLTCQHGVCATAPCEEQDCGPTSACCGGACCGAGEVCCDLPGGPARPPQCVAADAGTCGEPCLECA
jgi:hypothetical protein